MAPHLDEVDRELMIAESNASPGQFSPAPEQQRRASHEIERVITASSVSTTTSEETVSRRPVGMSRIPTEVEGLQRTQTELSRIQTAKSQHSATVGQSLKNRKSNKPLPAFGAGRPFPPPLPSRDEYVVEFDGPDDPYHGQNWSTKKKVLTAAMLGYTTVVSSFASSIFSASTQAVAKEFGVSPEVGILGTSFYVLGFALGPMFWAPLSELKGRRLPIIIGMFAFSIFTISTAIAKDLQSVLVLRFFSGISGASPLAVVGAIFSDIFSNATRGVAITLFSMTVFTGPLLAPFIGGYIVESYLGWRWTLYIPSFLGFVAFIMDFFLLEETYPPVILVEKAAELRRRTKNWGIHAKQEEIEVDFAELIQKNFTRPMRLLFLEPIVTFLSIYTAFIYGLLYLFLSAYPIVFEGVFGFTPGVSGLTFFGMIIGEVLAGIAVLATQPSYQRKLAANNGIPVPEWRLPIVIAGGLSFTGGIFWFGWTGYTNSFHWAVPAASGILTGFGLLTIFLQCLNYLVDSYLMFAASAIAANTFLRSLFGSVFPLFATYLFKNLGINYAATLLGSIAALLIPIPVLFYFFGHKLRQKSKFTPTALNKPTPVAMEKASSSSHDEDELDPALDPIDHAATSNIARTRSNINEA
ncbi:polyamine transporter 1 [Xylariaceae sp. FL0255]|nr:polyamine transporter 1 [Xylariaceae sp. FL0255]